MHNTLLDSKYFCDYKSTRVSCPEPGSAIVDNKNEFKTYLGRWIKSNNYDNKNNTFMEMVYGVLKCER